MAGRRTAAGMAVVAAVIAAVLAFRLRERAPRVLVLGRMTPAFELERRFGLHDPLSPERPVWTLEPTEPAFAGIAARASDDRAWVGARPLLAHRYERTPAERGGVDPCAMPPAKQSFFGAWKSVSSKGYVALPRATAVRQNGEFDVILLFHGHDIALTALAQADVAIVLHGATLADYRSEYAGPEALEQLLLAVEARVSSEAKRAARAKNVALAAWSGGYDAISILLEQSTERERVDAVVLLDGLHCSRDPAVMPKQLAPFLKFAQRAAEGKAFMFMSHSSIDTDGFASTTETMHFLASELGGKPLRVSREDPLGLQLIELFDRGGFHMRGYAGGGKRDHCATLGLYPLAARALARRWQDQ